MEPEACQKNTELEMSGAALLGFLEQILQTDRIHDDFNAAFFEHRTHRLLLGQRCPIEASSERWSVVFSHLIAGLLDHLSFGKITTIIPFPIQFPLTEERTSRHDPTMDVPWARGTQEHMEQRAPRLDTNNRGGERDLPRSTVAAHHKNIHTQSFFVYPPTGRVALFLQNRKCLPGHRSNTESNERAT